MVYFLLQFPVYLAKIYSDHITGMLRPFQPVIRIDPKSAIGPQNLIPNPDSRVLWSTKQRFNKQYIFAVVILSMIWIDVGIDMLQEDFDIHTEEELYFRALTRVWSSSALQKDGIVGAGGLTTFFIFWSLLFDKMLHLDNAVMFMLGPKNELRIFCRNRFLAKQHSDYLVQIWKFWNPKFQFINYNFLFSVVTFLTLPFYGAEIFFPDHLSWTPHRIFVFLLLGLMSSYCAFMPMTTNCFLMTSIYLHKKQQFWINKIGRLTLKMCRNKSKALTKQRIFCWQYKTIVHNVLGLGREIKYLNRFWDRFLTVLLLLYVFEVVFQIFSILIYSIKHFPNYLLPFYTLSYFCYLYAISHSCSKIVENNLKIHTQMKRFQVRCRLEKESIGMLLKFDMLEGGSGYWKKCSFKLANGYAINNRLFEGAFMMLVWLALHIYPQTITKLFFSLS